MKFFEKLKKKESNSANYNLWKLIDRRMIEPISQIKSPVHIICDIDKTYLETEFESLGKIAKIALEDAYDKRTVSGATTFLLASRWGRLDRIDSHHEFPRGLHFVSSSPPQLRKVLEEKMALDGLDWNSDTFKNQAYNIKKWRFDLLKQQVAYKTAAILTLLEQIPSGAQLHLIGDNAEADAIIYLGIKLFVEKKLSAKSYIEFLSIAGVEKNMALKLVEKLNQIPSHLVSGIYIRMIKKNVSKYESPLTLQINTFDDYFEAALLFVANNIIASDSLWALTRHFHNLHDVELGNIGNMLTKVFTQQELLESQQQDIRKVMEFLHLSPIEFNQPKIISDRKNRQEEFDQLNEHQILLLLEDWIQKI